MAPEQARHSNMDVDYVVTYRFSDSDKEQAISQYDKLVQALAGVGLSTEVRNGENHSLLIFVRPESEQNLFAEVYRSRTKDWLHGVRSAAPEKESEISGQNQLLYEAERLRIIYQLITNPVEEGGAGITPQHGDWKHVESIFTLHDEAFNKRWLKEWATKYTLKMEDLDEIRDRLGEKVAFYFAFTQFYFTTLIGIAAFGASAYFLLGFFSPIYAIVNAVVCLVFVEWWRHQEYDLAVRWGVRGVTAIENKRHDFRPEKVFTDPATGEKIAFFPSGKRLTRQLLQVPFALLAAAALGALIAFAFSIEIFMSEIYSGPGQSILVFLPTGILTTIQPLLLGFLSSLASKLNDFENHETDLAHETAYTQKIFILNFITSYLPILLTAFVYVPFATDLVPYLDVFSLTVEPFATDAKETAVPQAGSFKINPGRLRKQVIYFVVTAQIVNQATEILVPYLKRRGFASYKSYKSKKAAQAGTAQTTPASPTAADPPEEQEFLQRVRNEAELDKYEVTDDLREMVVQYGYLSLFSCVWPLTAVSFLVNNWFELRTDAAKICNEVQRPIPWRADSIGPWLDSLGFLTWAGSLTTSALVYMFNGQESIGPGGRPDTIKASGLLLSILASENVYFLARAVVKYAITKIDSPGRSQERAERYLVRKRYLEESRGEQAAKIAPKLVKSFEEKPITRQSLEDEAREASIHGTNPTMRFWARQKGWQESSKYGATLIQRAAMAEGKKAQ
ncbi:MAG: hypothetical protein Q9159_002150 [Coniocarpon cinnabarinum]